jgi:hypothetical protein
MRSFLESTFAAAIGSSYGVFAIWFVGAAWRYFEESLGAASAILTEPFVGLPTLIERLDASCSSEKKSVVVIRLQNPIRLAFASLFFGSRYRREWLKENIRGLPKGSSHAYLLHYWDRSGYCQIVLTSDPERGLSQPPPRACSVRNRILAAYVGQSDVTVSARRIAASFHESEPPVCAAALQAYLWREHGLRLSPDPLVITDGSLKQISYGTA